MLIKTILNTVEKFKSFVYKKVFWKKIAGIASDTLIIEMAARKNSRGDCPTCLKPCPTYDKQPLRHYEYVPLWGFRTYFSYAPRRVECREHGVHVEKLPWCSGKEHLTKTYQLFLANWAKRLSWKEVAFVFKAS